jgi:hypothetical protein
MPDLTGCVLIFFLLMQAMQMDASVAGQQTERILLARIADLLSGVSTAATPGSPASTSTGGGLVGNVGGFTAVSKKLLSTTVGTYAAGNSIGGLITFANAVRTPGTGIIESVHLFDLDHNAVAMDLLILDQAPSVTPADKTTWAVTNIDAQKVVGRIAIASGDWVTYNNVAFVTEKGLGIAVKASAAAGTNLYGVLLCNASTPAFTGITNVGVDLGILQD